MRSEHLYVIGGLAAVLISAPAHANDVDESGQVMPMSLHFRIDDSDPEAHLPSAEEQQKRPLEVGYMLMDLDERAELAKKRGDYRQALKYHRAGQKLMPDRAVSHALMCEDYERLGMRREAVESCGTALGLPGAKPEHFVRFVHLVASRPGELDPAELKDARAAIAHVKQQKATALVGAELQCELAVRAKDVNALEQCTEELNRAAPLTPRAVSFSWALAVERGDLMGARTLLAKAKAAGVDTQAVAKMERATDQLERDRQREEVGARLSRGGDLPAVRWLLALLVVALIGLLLGRRIVRGDHA